MKEQKNIPTTKVERAAKFLTTGAKIGRNYLKHYGKKLVDPSTTRDQLHEDNATDIYDSLSKLKGSALKVARDVPDRMEVVGLAAARSVSALAQQAAETGAKQVALFDESGVVELRTKLPAGVKVYGGAIPG